MIDTVLTAFRAPDIRRKLLFTLGILAIFRALTNVPVPNVNTQALTDLFTNNPLLGILNIFSGGGLAAASVIGLGVNPYINASIIMQLMRGVIPALEELSRRGRVRPQPPQPVHAHADRAARPRAGLRHQRAARPPTA